MSLISVYDPRTMLEAIKQMKPVRTYLKDTFFTTTRTFTTEKVDVDYYKGRRKMAPFVSPRIAGKVMEREGFNTKTFAPPMIQPERVITAEDLTQRTMGEHVYSGTTPDERQAEMMAHDLMELDEMITRREEWMVSQALFSGQIHMIGEGVDQILDYDFTNKISLSGGDSWDDPNSDPYADLKNWRLSIIQKSGITPDRVIMASDVVDVFIKHPKMKEMLDNRRIILGQINPQALPNGVTYIGSISALGLDIYSYDEWYLDTETDPKNHTEKPMVPEGTLLIGSTRARSSMLYGAVTIIKDDSNNFVTYEGTRIPDSWVQKRPSARFLQINSRPLPVPHEVDSWYVAKVVQ
ncbi:major capsid protein [Chengkuizengella axinellae]|uniref:Major capsid protein n=1 Tax=Chengkuizengella axinellae TaxID=3064388 RepID=A0ABT9J6D7_9BACL|nr:major capsid protein [Chengkuizengella sp. 2205SS18-9]MDP5277149.1 major capsid protein [Chengkuizengella sp. 2205SS18-9]